MEIGQRRGRHAGGERGRVQLVIRVQDQRDVERARRQRIRPVAGQHVEKVRGVPERRIRLDRPAAGLHPPVGRDEAPQLRRQPHGLSIVRLRRVIRRVAIVVTERRRQRPQRVHAIGGRQLLHQPQDRLLQRAAGCQLRLQITELGPVRKPPVPEQVTDLLERRSPREVVDVVPVVREHTAIAIEIANRRRCGDDVFETSFGLRFGRHGGRISGARSSELGVRIQSESRSQNSSLTGAAWRQRREKRQNQTGQIAMRAGCRRDQRASAAKRRIRRGAGAPRQYRS